MQKWRSIKRRLFIQKLRKLGFNGPYSGTKHQFMTYENHRLAIPSNKEYSVPQLKFMLSEIEHIVNKTIDLEGWNAL